MTDGGGGGAGAAQGHGGHRARGLRPHRLLHRQRDVRGVAAWNVLGHGHGALPGVPGRGGCHVSRVARGTCVTFAVPVTLHGHRGQSHGVVGPVSTTPCLSRVTCNM